MEVNLKKQGKILVNINKLFNGKKNAMKFVDDYVLMILEPKKSSWRRT